MTAHSMLVLGKGPTAVRTACQCLCNLGVRPCVEWTSTSLVRSVAEDTLGIVIVEDEPERAARICQSLRRWAHASIFPIVVLTEGIRSVALWRAATAALAWPQDALDFVQIVTHMREHATLELDPHEILEAWELRERLRADLRFRYPMTFEVFVGGDGVLVGGLVSDRARRDLARELVASAAPLRTICTAGLGLPDPRLEDPGHACVEGPAARPALRGPRVRA